MATLFTRSCTCSTLSQKKDLSFYSFSNKKIHSLTFSSRAPIKRFNFSVKYENTEESDSSTSTSSSVVISKNEEKEDDQKKDLFVDGESGVEVEEQQEMDWKTDEEFKKFMGNPSIEAAIKLEKKRADRKLKELDRENSDNPVVGLLKKVAVDSLSRQKDRLEKAEEAFKALDINKLKSCFGFNTFFARDVRRFGDGGIFIGNLRKPVEEVILLLEQKLSEAAGREVVLWLMEEKAMTLQNCR